MSVKVRIAPSPTGNLHIGTARAALFNWLYAKKIGGEFILRIEDTDLERSEKKYEDDIVEGLKKLGITWDGEIYRQSERLEIYKRYLNELLSSGKATVKTFSEEEKDALRKEGIEPRDSIIVLVVDSMGPAVEFSDGIRGTISVERKHLGSVSLAKDENTPLYNFAAVIDDIEMGITDVIRGEDHISNTPKQLLIYEALGKTPPQFAHLPLILNPDKTKLSKRKSPVSVDDYVKDYLPEALINFIGFLGYTYSKEILTKEEMAQEFDLGKVHKSGAVFNIEKLNWINAQYTKNLSADRLESVTGVRVPEKALPLITERLERLSQVHEYEYLWKAPEVDPRLLLWKNSSSDDVKKSLETSRRVIELGEVSDKERMRKELDAAAAGNRGLIYWPLRVALSGKKASPDPVDIAAVIGKEETVRRIENAVSKL
jgi:nondiscriminating glutamyl-tRNA synthetase